MPNYGTLSVDCPAALELNMVREGGYHYDSDGERHGFGLADHIKRFARLAWPDFKWEHGGKRQRWAHMICDEVSTGGTTACFGPASSGKTATSGLTMLVLYWAHPENFTGLCSTTTLDKLDLRIWGEIKMRFKQAKERYPWLSGNIIDSRRRICTDAKNEMDGRDFRNGILGLACQRSSGEWQGLGDYSGIKNTYVMLIADECHVMQPGFLQGVSNLKSNRNFTAVFLGNLVDLETPLGEAAEPDCGWDALPDSNVSRIYKTKAFNGRAIQLIGKDSPNFDFPEGREPYDMLIGRRFIAELKHDCGEGSPMYLAQAGGGIPRSSLSNRVITKQVCHQFNAFEPAVWGSGKLIKLYCMDVSYTVSHGDRTCGAALQFGLDVDGKPRLAFMEKPKVFALVNLGGRTVEEAVATMAKAEMDRFGIPFAHFFYDGTGRSSFTAAAMRIIGTMIQPVEFGGKASERPNFMGRRFQEGDKKGELMPCNMVFGKFVTELWFATRYLIEADQQRDLPEDTAKDGYMRLWSLGAGNKIDVEPKHEMKARVNRSPDLYDMYAVGVEGARRLGFTIGTALTTSRNARGNAWLRDLKVDLNKQLREQELTYG